MFDLTGRIAFVTGAASGNGKGGANALAKQGAAVVLADISDKVFDVEKEIKEKGYDAFAVKMDVTDSASVKAAVDAAVEKYGKIDILFNNAGVMRLMPIADTSDEDRDFNFDINIKGTWNVAKAVFPLMAEAGYGRIINTASVTGVRVADAGSAAYAMSKAAILGLTRSLAMEGAQCGVSCNAICPGIIRTRLYDELIETGLVGTEDDLMGALTQIIPQRRVGTPDDIGALVAFLASEESGYVTGTSIVIDGGSTLFETTP